MIGSEVVAPQEIDDAGKGTGSPKPFLGAGFQIKRVLRYRETTDRRLHMTFRTSCMVCCVLHESSACMVGAAKRGLKRDCVVA